MEVRRLPDKDRLFKRSPMRSTTRSRMSPPVLWLWAAAIAAAPVILISPGLPQLMHALLVGALAAMATTYFVPVLIDRTMLLFACLWLASTSSTPLGGSRQARLTPSSC